MALLTFVMMQELIVDAASFSLIHYFYSLMVADAFQTFLRDLSRSPYVMLQLMRDRGHVG